MVHRRAVRPARAGAGGCYVISKRSRRYVALFVHYRRICNLVGNISAAASTTGDRDSRPFITSVTPAPVFTVTVHACTSMRRMQIASPTPGAHTVRVSRGGGSSPDSRSPIPDSEPRLRPPIPALRPPGSPNSERMSLQIVNNIHRYFTNGYVRRTRVYVLMSAERQTVWRLRYGNPH